MRRLVTGPLFPRAFQWSALAALLVWSAAALASGGALFTRMRRLALPAAVVVAAGHMAKGLAKLADWAGHLPLALADPQGAATAAAIAAGDRARPRPLLPFSAVAAIGSLLLLAGAALAIREARLSRTPSPSSGSGRS